MPGSVLTTDELAGLFIEAAGGGVETSLSDIIVLLNLEDEPPLTAALTAAEYFQSYGLAFRPDLPEGELETRRVLYRPSSNEQRVALVRELIAQGESFSCEFKQSLFTDMKRFEATGSLHSLAALEGECLKTIAAFLNSDGGHLLVGVRDDGQLCEGIAHDLALKSWNLDKWLLHWEMLFKQRFWRPSEVRPSVDPVPVQIDGQVVLHVAVSKSERPTFVRREPKLEFEYFVRRGPSTHSLSLPEFADHLAR